MLSKPLPRDPFEKHRDFIMGWPRSPDKRECEDSLGTSEESVTVNLTNPGISNPGQDRAPPVLTPGQDLVPPVLTPTVTTDGELGQPGHPTDNGSLTTDAQTPVAHIICSPKLHIHPPKSILRRSKYSRQD